MYSTFFQFLKNQFSAEELDANLNNLTISIQYDLKNRFNDKMFLIKLKNENIPSNINTSFYIIDKPYSDDKVYIAEYSEDNPYNEKTFNYKEISNEYSFYSDFLNKFKYEIDFIQDAIKKELIKPNLKKNNINFDEKINLDLNEDFSFL